MSSGTPSVIAMSGFTDRASGWTTGQMIPRTDPTARGSANVTGTRTVLSRPIRLLRPSPRVSFGGAARRRPELLNRYRWGPRHKDSIPPPCSGGFVSTRSPACKPAIRFASFGGETDSGSWWIGRVVGCERRRRIARARVGVSAAVAPQLAKLTRARRISPRRYPGVQGRFAAVPRAYRNRTGTSQMRCVASDLSRISEPSHLVARAPNTDS
jgi:hypothetical protein